ncbi:hypothetical protein M9H77_07937 [Catharanthus roseus]|uniref:Uncharacterized protein n=1 Tax=Catharanthus roseus TaxID=4058 RepID=A0ACC0BWB3_CATRO|nr:hypothetical protein M9H77_07937 [Catharanthus roseus]
MDQESHEAKDLLHRPFTSARPKKINRSFDDEGQAPKLLIISTISKDYSREQFGCEKEQVLPCLPLPLSIGFWPSWIVRTTPYRVW